MPKILLIEDETNLLRVYRRDLEGDGYSVVTATSRDTFPELLDSVSPDMVLYDAPRSEPDALESLRAMLDHCPRVPVLLVLEQGVAANSPLRATADAVVARSPDTRRLRAQVRGLFAPDGA